METRLGMDFPGQLIFNPACDFVVLRVAMQAIEIGIPANRQKAQISPFISGLQVEQRFFSFSQYRVSRGQIVGGAHPSSESRALQRQHGFAHTD